MKTNPKLKLVLLDSADLKTSISRENAENRDFNTINGSGVMNRMLDLDP